VGGLQDVRGKVKGLEDRLAAKKKISLRSWGDVCSNYGCSIGWHGLLNASREGRALWALSSSFFSTGSILLLRPHIIWCLGKNATWQIWLHHSLILKCILWERLKNMFAYQVYYNSAEIPHSCSQHIRLDKQLKFRDKNLMNRESFCPTCWLQALQQQMHVRANTTQHAILRCPFFHNGPSAKIL